MRPIYIFALASITVLTAGCSKKENEETKSPDDELPRVELSVAHRQDVDQRMTYTATVEADNINNIAPASPNRIKTITVDVGDKVAKGQVIATLDPSNAEQLKFNLDNAQREYDRAVQLLNIGSGTQQAVDQLRTQLNGLRTQYNNMMENTVLRSPISGVVTARNYDPGDMTGSLPVVTVGQITPNVKVMINVTENDYEKIRQGMTVKVTFDAFEGEEFTGKVSRIYPTVDPQTRTFKVEILIGNPGGKILPGMFARVDLNLETKSNIVVPDRAVVKQSGSGNRYVYVYSNGTVSYNLVELGQRLDDSYELLSGIVDGDSVVISGQSRLADGVKVKVIEKLPAKK